MRLILFDFRVFFRLYVLAQYSGPAAKVAERLAAAGHKEFDVRFNNFAKAAQKRRAAQGLGRGLGRHSDSSKQLRMNGNYGGSDDDSDSDGDLKISGKGSRGKGKKRGSKARRHSDGGGGGDDEDGGGGGGNLLGAAIFGEEYAKSHHQAQARRKVRPYKEPSVSEEMMERAREYREHQMAASRINRFAQNTEGNVGSYSIPVHSRVRLNSRRPYPGLSEVTDFRVNKRFFFSVFFFCFFFRRREIKPRNNRPS